MATAPLVTFSYIVTTFFFAWMLKSIDLSTGDVAIKAMKETVRCGTTINGRLSGGNY